jgi:superfamily II DNA or RNA helicase
MNPTITVGTHYSQLSNCDFRVKEDLIESFKVRTYAYSHKTHEKFPVGFVSFLDDNGKFRTGLMELVVSRLTSMNVVPVIVDNRVREHVFRNPIQALENFEERPYVQPAIDALVTHERGIWHCATNSGKTYMAAAAVHHLGLPSLFIVPPQRSSLVDQTYDVYKQVGFNMSEVGRIKASVFPDKKHVIASCATLSARIEEPATLEYLKRFKFIIYDECQELPESAQTVLDQCPAIFRLFLSGTPFTRDKHHDLRLLGFSGRILAKVSNEYLIENGYSAEPHVIYLPVQHATKLNRYETDYGRAYKQQIVHNESRNDMIAQLVHALVNIGEDPVIMVNQKEHARILVSKIRNYSTSCELYTGDQDTNERRKQLNAFSNDDIDAIVANQVLDVGISIPDITVLIIAGGGKKLTTNLQRAGRGLRKKKHRNVLFIIDIQDDLLYMKGQSNQRREIWRTQRGFLYHEVKDVTELLSVVEQVSHEKSTMI